MRLANKVTVVTGASSGIGRASAIMFAKEGAKVVVADINDAGGEETANTIKSNGGEAIYVHTDVSKASEAENLIKVSSNKFGSIDVLFNNAGRPHDMVQVEDLMNQFGIILMPSMLKVCFSVHWQLQRR